MGSVPHNRGDQTALDRDTTQLELPTATHNDSLP